MTEPQTVESDACIIVSDTHFEEGKDDPRLSVLTETALEKGCPLFFLGDLVNLWFESRKLAEHYTGIFTILREFSSRGGRGIFIPGNRDFLAGPVFHRSTGLTILPEFTNIRVRGNLYRLLHGDQIFLGDRNYRTYRTLVRTRAVRGILAVSPDFLLRAVAGILKRDPSIPPEDKEIPLDRKRFIKRVYSQDISTYICGHIHRNMKVTEEIDSRTVTVYTLNSWIYTPEYCVIDKNGMRFLSLDT